MRGPVFENLTMDIWGAAKRKWQDETFRYRRFMVGGRRHVCLWVWQEVKEFRVLRQTWWVGGTYSNQGVDSCL